MSGRDERALRTTLAARGVSIEALTRREDGTLGTSARTLLAPDAVAGRGTVLGHAREVLEIGGVLGRGGMGEVRTAKQRSLRREVAVKTAIERCDAAIESALLKEAWAGAALEHPSVVPIHTLMRIDGGAAVVMKRIAGTSWARLIAFPEASPRFSGEGALDAHLHVLVQVCHAIAFAHAHGIVHLDLKPENVMVGELGEVYVLDWGLAARIDGGPEFLPHVSTIPLPAGTPGYLAPELAAAQGDRVGAATDVYLLGAVLHHVVTGRVRHDGDNLLATLVRAFADDPPEYGPEVPRGLAEILRTAMQREPADRFASADAMREAIESFLRHRPAEHFMARAREAIAAIEARLAEYEKGDVEIEPLLAECEVALAEVRRAWPEHPGLPAAEETLVARRASHAIVEDRLEAARALVRAVSNPSSSLIDALAALEKRLDARTRYEQGLEQLAREVDLSLGSSARRRLFRIFSALWAVFGIVLGTANRLGVVEIGYGALLVEGAVLVAVLGPFAWLRRDRYLANRANRRLWGGLAFVAVAVETLFVSLGLSGVPADFAVALTPVIYAFGFATLGVALDRRFAFGAIPLLVAAAVASRLPSYAYDIVGVGGGLAALVVLSGWRDSDPERAAITAGSA